MDFIPQFCPNPDCPTHLTTPCGPKSWFIRLGIRMTRVVGPVPRFRCRSCRKGFSSRTFDLDYWTHRRVDYHQIQQLLVCGAGLRQSCRLLGVSARLLANRHARLARQSLALHGEVMEDFSLTESLVLDGFESFAFSQYYPNNLNLLVTDRSQFVLGLNAAVLRRKGRMTKAQKGRRAKLEVAYKAEPSAIYRSSKQLLEYGCDLSFGSRHLPIRILSDQKPEYARALARIKPYGGWLSEGLLEHVTVNSKAPRTLENPLFAVNYLDRQLRKDLAEHVREGVRFARRLEFSLERAVIHLVHHNYFKVFRTRDMDQRMTHAQKAGLDPDRVSQLRERMFKDRALGWRSNLETWQTDLWRRSTGVPVHQVTPLAKHLLTA